LGSLEVNEMVEAMKISRFMVHPSYIDNSPNSICEAQILGLPVVATNVGGVESLIENGKTGLLIDRSLDTLIDG